MLSYQGSILFWSRHKTAPNDSSWPPRPTPCPPLPMENAVTWPCQLLLLPRRTLSLADSLLYSTFLASCCTRIPGSKATLSSFTHLCLSLFFPRGDTAQPSLQALGAKRAPPPLNLSPTSPSLSRPFAGSYWADSRNRDPQSLPSLYPLKGPNTVGAQSRHLVHIQVEEIIVPQRPQVQTQGLMRGN